MFPDGGLTLLVKNRINKSLELGNAILTPYEEQYVHLTKLNELKTAIRLKNRNDITIKTTIPQDVLDLINVKDPVFPEPVPPVSGLFYRDEFNQFKGKLDVDLTDVKGALQKKADQAELEQTRNLLAGKANDSEVRKNSVLINSTDVSDELRQKITGNAPINATVGLRSVSELKTTFINRGKNLFNKNTVMPGKFIKYIDGKIGDNPTYSASDYIPITPSTSFYKNDNLPHYAWYTENFTFIPGYENKPGNVIVSPPNAFYLRITAYTVDLNTTMLNIGTTPQPYEGYRETLMKELLNEVPTEKLTTPVSRRQVSFLKTSKNLFDPSVIKNDVYINYQNGQEAVNNLYVASDFIEVESGLTYYRTFSHQMAFYNENKAYISGLMNLSPADLPSTFVVPPSAKYVRLTVAKTSLPTFQLEKGETYTGYEKFGYYLNGVEIPSTKDDILVFLPPVINIAVGRTIELYNRQVVFTGNHDNFHVQWKCQVGKAMKRKWSCLGESGKIGSYPMILNVYDNNMTLIKTASTVIKIHQPSLAPLKILAIGDSLSNAKPWYQEVIRLSNDQWSYVGTRWNGDIRGGKRNHEGRSGATAEWYLKDSTYTFETNGISNKNPFWNPGASKFDYTYYKNTHSINPDVIQVFLGTNGIQVDPTANATNIKAIVDGIRVADASIKIFVVFTLYRGDQDGIGNQLNSDGYSSGNGVWKLEEDRKVFNLMVKLHELLKGDSNVFFIPVSLTHDSEYNFKGTTPVPVNPRSTLTEFRDTEATHPSASNAGYEQMADIMFSVISAQ